MRPPGAAASLMAAQLQKCRGQFPGNDSWSGAGKFRVQSGQIRSFHFEQEERKKQIQFVFNAFWTTEVQGLSLCPIFERKAFLCFSAFWRVSNRAAI